MHDSLSEEQEKILYEVTKTIIQKSNLKYDGETLLATFCAENVAESLNWNQNRLKEYIKDFLTNLYVTYVNGREAFVLRFSYPISDEIGTDSKYELIFGEAGVEMLAKYNVYEIE